MLRSTSLFRQSRFWQLKLERKVPSYKDEDRDSLSENLPQYPGLPMMKDTADNYADVAKPPSPPSPRPAQDRIQHLQLLTPPNNRFLPAPLLLDMRKATGSPRTGQHLPPSPHADDAGSDSESDVDLFRIPLSNKRTTGDTDDKPSTLTHSGGPESRSKNAQYVEIESSSVHPVPPVPSVPLALPRLQSTCTISRTKMGAPGGSVVVDFDELEGPSTDEQQPTPEEKGEEDVTAFALEGKAMKQEQRPSIYSGPTTIVVPQDIESHTLSQLGAQAVSFRGVVVPPLLSLEDSLSTNNAPKSTSTQKPHEDESKVTPATPSRVGTVQKVSTSQDSVSSSASKPRTALWERAKYQFEADSEDDEMEDEIDANIKLLGGAAGRLNILAKATGIELEAQNRHLQGISMKVSVDILWIVCGH
jgi:hypothetical protein